MSNPHWYIQPRLILDKEKYRGKGRPRKIDYRMFPDKNKDFHKVLPMKVKETSDGYKINFKVKINLKSFKGIIGNATM